MVLHNDKWKYKAKKNVERKHAQQNRRKNGPAAVINGDNTEESESESSNSEEESENEEIDGQEKSINHFGRKKKESNSWRFEDPIVDESILKDPEYIAQLNAIKQEEENRSNYMRQVVSDKLKGVEFEKLPNVESKESKTIKSFKKMTKKDLEKLALGSDSEEEKYNDSNEKPYIREFTSEERTNFLKLQEKIKHQKEMDKIRTRMDKINNKLPTEKAKILELNSKVGADNYRGIVDDRLNKRYYKLDTNALDNLVFEMNGINMNIDEDLPKPVEQFDLDNMVKSDPTRLSIKKSSGENTSTVTPVVDLDNSELDDFLDSVL